MVFWVVFNHGNPCLFPCSAQVRAGPNDMVYTCSNPEESHGKEGSLGDEMDKVIF